MAHNLSRKILVTYASRSGSTVGVADAIGKTLAESGLEVDVRPMKDVHDLTPYHAVVAGSAVRMEKWLPEALQFIQRHQQELTQKPFAAFLVCIALAGKTGQPREQANQTASAWLQPVRDLIDPVSEGLFAGVLDVGKVPELGYRLAFRAVIALGLWAEGDYRDWDAIRQWAHDLSSMLVEREQVGAQQHDPDTAVFSHTS